MLKFINMFLMTKTLFLAIFSICLYQMHFESHQKGCKRNCKNGGNSAFSMQHNSPTDNGLAFSLSSHIQKGKWACNFWIAQKQVQQIWKVVHLSCGSFFLRVFSNFKVFLSRPKYIFVVLFKAHQSCQLSERYLSKLGNLL